MQLVLVGCVWVAVVTGAIATIRQELRAGRLLGAILIGVFVLGPLVGIAVAALVPILVLSHYPGAS